MGAWTVLVALSVVEQRFERVLLAGRRWVVLSRTLSSGRRDGSRSLLIVLLTDIVGSTERGRRPGPRRAPPEAGRFSIDHDRA